MSVPGLVLACPRTEVNYCPEMLSFVSCLNTKTYFKWRENNVFTAKCLINILSSLPHTHDVALGVLLEVGLDHPGCVLPVGHDAAAGEKVGSRSAFTSCGASGRRLLPGPRLTCPHRGQHLPPRPHPALGLWAEMWGPEQPGTLVAQHGTVPVRALCHRLSRFTCTARQAGVTAWGRSGAVPGPRAAGSPLASHGHVPNSTSMAVGEPHSSTSHGNGTWAPSRL